MPPEGAVALAADGPAQQCIAGDGTAQAWMEIVPKSYLGPGTVGIIQLRVLS